MVDEPPESDPPQSLRVISIMHPNQAMGRLLISLALGVGATLLTPRDIELPVRAVVGWDTGSLTLILMAWVMIARANAKETEARASAYDPGRWMVWVIALAASLFSLFAATAVLGKVHHYHEHAGLWSALALIAMSLSWILTHTAYTLRYAHLYYRSPRCGGIDFPGG